MGENRVLTTAKVGARCYSTFEPASSNFCMTIDVFVLQIMISGEIQAVNIGNTRLVPGFPQGSNSLEKASALRRGGLGVDTPIFGDFLPRATIFLVLTAFNSVLPELVVLISTTNSGRTALNAASTKKVVARGRKSPKIGVSTPSPPRLTLGII